MAHPPVPPRSGCQHSRCVFTRLRTLSQIRRTSPSLLFIRYKRRDGTIPFWITVQRAKPLERYDPAAFDGGSIVPCVSGGRRNAHHNPGQTHPTNNPITH